MEMKKKIEEEEKAIQNVQNIRKKKEIITQRNLWKLTC